MDAKSDRGPGRTYAEYAGYYTAEMRRRAVEAGCRTVAEYAEWLERNYGRDRNRFHGPGPWRRP